MEYEKKIEEYPKSISLEGTEIIFDQMKKAVCKINIGNKKGIGFFCKIPFPDSFHLLPVLITDSYLLNIDKVIEGQIIQFTMEDKEDKLSFKISSDINRITYISKQYNITIIKIKENDKLNSISFLEIDEQIFTSNLNKEIDIYLLHYPELKKSDISIGKITKIKNDNSKFCHICNSSIGSLGGPLINVNNCKVIGMHKGKDE